MNMRDLDVLNILWKAKQPMMATDIVNQQMELTQSTVTAVLRKLLRNGYVDVAGVTHSGKVLSRTYVPTELSRTAVLNHFLDLYQSFSDIIPKEMMIEELSKIDEPSKKSS